MPEGLRGSGGGLLWCCQGNRAVATGGGGEGKHCRELSLKVFFPLKNSNSGEKLINNQKYLMGVNVVCRKYDTLYVKLKRPNLSLMTFFRFPPKEGKSLSGANPAWASL